MIPFTFAFSPLATMRLPGFTPVSFDWLVVWFCCATTGPQASASIDTTVTKRRTPNPLGLIDYFLLRSSLQNAELRNVPDTASTKNGFRESKTFSLPSVLVLLLCNSIIVVRMGALSCLSAARLSHRGSPPIHSIVQS